MDSGRHQLVPLFIALEHIYRQVYTERTLGTAPSRCSDALDGLAHAVSSLAPLWAYSEDGGEVRELTARELASGLFRQGGQTLYFVDGPAPINNLAIRASAIGSVIAALIEGFPVDNDGR